jgi:hypothetical protein
MKALRILTIAAASSAILSAVVPSAQAVDLGMAGKAAGAATRNAVPVVENAIGAPVGAKVDAVQKTLNGGTEAVSGVNDLVG